MKSKIIIISVFFLLNAIPGIFAQKKITYGNSGSALGSNDQFVLSGLVKGSHDKYVYLQRFDNKMLLLLDSAKIDTDGSFKFNTKPKLPELYALTLDPKVDLLYPFYVFLENKNLTAVVDSTNNYQDSKLTGSALNDLFETYNADWENVKIEEFIRQHPASLVSAYELYRNYSYRLSADQLEQYTAMFDPSLAGTPYVQALKALPATYRKSGIGKKAIDFVQQDITGRKFKLSEHYGKYLLVDFWASWCPPCRAESPNLKRIYNKYKGKGFEIIGVSFDKNKDRWLQAIKEDGLPWFQVSDLTYWNNSAGKLYGVRLIPTNVLIDPKGYIIGRNLHGDQIEKTLGEIFDSPSNQKSK